MNGGSKQGEMPAARPPQAKVDAGILTQMSRPAPAPGRRSSGGRGGKEGLLAARVVGAAPVLPAALGALAGDHLDGAGGAGPGEEVALRGELEEGERLFWQQAVELVEQAGAVDELDVFLGGEFHGFLGEAAGGDHDAFADAGGGHRAAQLAERLDADPVGVPARAVDDDGGGAGAFRAEGDAGYDGTV